MQRGVRRHSHWYARSVLLLVSCVVVLTVTPARAQSTPPPSGPAVAPSANFGGCLITTHTFSANPGGGAIADGGSMDVTFTVSGAGNWLLDVDLTPTPMSRPPTSR